MEGLLLLVAEIVIIGIAVWVVTTETKMPEEISRVLDMAKQPPKPRFPELAQTGPQPPERPSRPRRL